MLPVYRLVAANSTRNQRFEHRVHVLHFEIPFRYTEGMDDLGAKIRAARKHRGWTLEALATRSGLSTGFLSQVERELTTLSIVSLSAICRALDLPMASLFSSNRPIDDPPSTVTRADQQLHIRIGTAPISYQYLSAQLPDAPIQELLIAEFPPGCDQRHSSHAGEELGYVLTGSLRLCVNDDRHDLHCGDSYRVAPSQPHSYHTSSSEGAAVLMAVTERFVELPPRPSRTSPDEKEG